MIAWTGGSPPRPLLEIGREERALVHKLFHANYRLYDNYWGDVPKGVRIQLWRWARFDAHATMRL